MSRKIVKALTLSEMTLLAKIQGKLESLSQFVVDLSCISQALYILIYRYFVIITFTNSQFHFLESFLYQCQLPRIT